LEPLRRAAHEQTESLIPNLIHPVTPITAKKKQFNSIRDKLQILSSPTRATLEDAESFLDYAIIAKLAQKDIVKLQKEKLELEARQIRNPDGGAYTIRQLREMVSDRAQQELQITNKRQAKDQEAWFKQLREEALLKEDNRPKLRGRAAAKAKASREALEATRWEEIHKTFTDPNTIEEQQRQLRRREVANKENRFLMITMVPKSHLEAIPNLEKWVGENSRPGEANEAEVIYVQTDIADDFISVDSTRKLPSLPGTSGSDEDDIEISTCPQVVATRGGPSNHSMMPFGVTIDVEEEIEISVMPQNGWGYERGPNHYSDEEDEGYVEVDWVILPAPRSRGRTDRSKK
jgi:glucan-binding YG repeat protein